MLVRALACSMLLAAGVASARSGGINSPTCMGCHSGNAAVTTAVTVTPASFNPGDTVTVRVSIQGPGSTGGLFLTTNGVGTLAPISGQSTRLINGDIVHSSPRSASGGQVTFDVRWTAPATKGGVVFQAATLSANGDGRSSGDSGSNGSLSTAFGCAGVTYYRDFDGDGVGAASSGIAVDCTQPQGYSALDGDCDENDAHVKPGAPEACNGKDDDCNGQVDEGLAAVTTWPDEDGDGYGAVNGAPASGCGGTKRATNATDCYDRDATIHPGAAETCNGRDDDCDGEVDEGAQVRCGVGWCARYGPTCNPADCTPGPPLLERCNALDDDCDGEVDEGEPCGAGATCFQGQCYEDSAVPDAGSTDVDAGVTPPPPSGGGGCASVPGSGLVALLAMLAWRRRGAQSSAGPSSGWRR